MKEVLPSEYPEVQSTANLKRLLETQVDMQFGDLRVLLELPKVADQAGCNLTTAMVLFNLVAGASVCFLDASAEALAGRGDRGRRFTDLLTRYYPWRTGEPLAAEEASLLVYEAARNPLAHSLGLDPPVAGVRGRSVVLRKWPLEPQRVQELEESEGRPDWVGATIGEVEREGGRISKFSFSVPAFYWGVHRMFRALFADEVQRVNAEALAGAFSHLWDRYSPGGAYVVVFRRRR